MAFLLCRRPHNTLKPDFNVVNNLWCQSAGASEDEARWLKHENEALRQLHLLDTAQDALPRAPVLHTPVKYYAA